MGHAPENTLASFELALRLGADAIEMDVQLSRDGRIVVFHDSGLKRVTGVRGTVGAASWRKLRELDAGAWFDKRFKGERVPMLSDVFTRFRHGLSHRGKPLRFVVELKPQISPSAGFRLARAVSAEIERFQVAARAIVISFSHDYLPAVTSPVKKGVLFSKRLKKPAALAHAVGADFLFPRRDLVTRVLMKEAREKNLGVFTWTANSKREFKRLTRLGVDGIATNYPDKLFRVLQS
jgi:glycerophosphoryl diester phosphodiesterase